MSSLFRPSILNVYKPPGLSSVDVLYRIKKLIPKSLNCKIGHFGTLDPFAEGVLLVGFFGATKLNEYIHELMPKKYLAGGVLGQETETGDLTVEVKHRDVSEYFFKVISQFSSTFIEEQLRQKFLGTYEQAPHVYSAAKYEGKKLHQWAREGVKIQKEKVAREIYSLNVKEINFPELFIEYEVSSGTYIRTLFSDSAHYLGTLGVLKTLKRTAIGCEIVENSFSLDLFKNEEDLFSRAKDIFEILFLSDIHFGEFDGHLLLNGQTITRESISCADGLYWFKTEKVTALLKAENKKFKIVTQFPCLR